MEIRKNEDRMTVVSLENAIRFTRKWYYHRIIIHNHGFQQSHIIRYHFRFDGSTY